MKKPGQWWDETLSPLSGCTPAGAGCDNCHSIRRMKRRLPYLRGKGNQDVSPHTVLLHPERLAKLDEWAKRRERLVVLMPMLGDLFHEQVPADYAIKVLEKLYDVNWDRATRRDSRPPHRFCILTKRYRRAVEIVGLWSAEKFEGHRETDGYCRELLLMFSVWDQESADRACAAAAKLPRGFVWGLHAEPLLGAIWLPFGNGCNWPLTVTRTLPAWIVTGGENGPGARPMDPDWCLSLAAQCKAAGVPYYHKGHGSVIALEMKRRGLTDVDPDNRLLEGEAWNEVPW